MSITNLYTLHAASLASPAITIQQMRSWDCSPNVAEMIEHSDSNIDATAVAIDTIDPRISMTCGAVKTILDNLGIVGAAISNPAGFVGYLKKRSSGSTYASGSTHKTLTVKKGIIVPRTLNATQSGATITLEVVTAYDGTNLPIVVSDNIALLAPTLTTEMFVAGKVSIEGTEIGGVQSITIDFGLNVQGRRGDGDAYTGDVFIYSRNPSITIRTLHAGQWGATALPLSGKYVSAGTTKLYLRKVDVGSTRVANATTEHIEFIINRGMASCQALSGSHGDDQAFDIRITPVYDGTNAWAVIDTTAAIS